MPHKLFDFLLFYLYYTSQGVTNPLAWGRGHVQPCTSLHWCWLIDRLIVLILTLMLMSIFWSWGWSLFVCSFVNVYFLLSVLIFDKKVNSVFMIPVRSPPACRRFPGFVFLFEETLCFSSWEKIFFSRETQTFEIIQSAFSVSKCVNATWDSQ